MPREKSPQRQLQDRVKNDFAQHPGSPLNDAIRADFGRLAQKMVKTLPLGREQSLVLTKLEEAMFYANAAIARNQQPAVTSSDAPARRTTALDMGPRKTAKKSSRRVTRTKRT